jgi:hypothetical protein
VRRIFDPSGNGARERAEPGRRTLRPQRQGPSGRLWFAVVAAPGACAAHLAVARAIRASCQAGLSAALGGAGMSVRASLLLATAVGMIIALLSVGIGFRAWLRAADRLATSRAGASEDAVTSGFLGFMTMIAGGAFAALILAQGLLEVGACEATGG